MRATFAVSVLAMDNTARWNEYMAATAEGLNDARIAEALSISPSTVGRWRAGTVDPKPRQVVAFARAFNDNPLAALVAAGYLTADDLGDDVTVRLPADVADVSTIQLLDEVTSRLESTAAVMNWLASIDAGSASRARMGLESIAEAHPGVAPSEFDPETVVRALAPHLEKTDLGGTSVWSVSEGGRSVTDLQDIATVHPIREDAPTDERLAAKRGRRKADQPHAD